MRGNVRVVGVWVVLLVTVTAWVSAGMFGLTAGHDVSRDSGKSALSGEGKLGFILPSVPEGSTVSPRPLLDAAFTPVYAGVLTSPNAQDSGAFGYSVAVSGTTVVVGAPFENVSGDVAAGHAYTFNARNDALISTFSSPNAVVGGYFGWSVVVSGATVVVGAPYETVSGESYYAGHAYTFNAKTGAPIATLTSPNAQTNGWFGWSVAVSGTTVVAGAYGESAFGLSQGGHVYLL